MNGRPTGISAFRPDCEISAWRAVKCAESWTRRMREPFPAANITAVSIVRAHIENNDRLIASLLQTLGHVDEHAGEEIRRDENEAPPESRDHWGALEGNQVIWSNRSPVLDYCPPLSGSIGVRATCRSDSSLLRGCRPVRSRLAKLADSGREDRALIQLWLQANARDCG